MTTDAQTKKVIILAGPNGAGKTTFARAFLPVEADLPRFINADQIAAGLAAFAPETAAIRAGRLMLEEIAACAGRGDSFAFETTLSGSNWLRAIRQWRERGYRVSLYFLSLPDVETAIARVVERVSQGGHDVPEAVIRRRFASGLDNFHRLYKLAVDDWTLYDNSDATPVLLAFGDNTWSAPDISQAKNPDQRGSLAALRRAAEMARATAIQTGTGIVISRDGKPVRISAEQLREGKA